MSKEKTSSTHIELSTDLKTDVKVKCAKQGKSMREVIEFLLKAWVAK